MNRANETCNTKENVKRSTCKACISREKKSSLSYEQRSQLQECKKKKNETDLY